MKAQGLKNEGIISVDSLVRNYISTMSPSLPNLDEMKEVSKTHNADKDLLYMCCVQPVKVHVHDDVYE